MQRRSAGDVHFERDLGGIKQVSKDLDSKINEVHGCFDKWRTGLVRMPGKLLASTGRSSGSIWTIAQLRFRDRVTRFRHEGTALVVDEEEFPKYGEHDFKLPGGDPYPDLSDWPRGTIVDYNERHDDAWKEKWTGHNLTITPSAVTLNEDNGYQAIVTVVSDSESMDPLWATGIEDWFSVNGLTVHNVAYQQSGLSVQYVISATEAQRNAIGYGTHTGTLLLRRLSSLYNGRTPNTRQLLTVDGDYVSARVLVTLDYPVPAVLSVTPVAAQILGPGVTGFTDSVDYTLSASGNSVDWTLTAAGAPAWMTISKNSGSLADGGSDTVTISVDTTGVSEDTYVVTLTWAHDGGTVVRTVSIAVVQYDRDLVTTSKKWSHEYYYRITHWPGVSREPDCPSAYARCVDIYDNEATPGVACADDGAGFSLMMNSDVRHSWSMAGDTERVTKQLQYTLTRCTIPDIGSSEEDWDNWWIQLTYKHYYVLGSDTDFVGVTHTTWVQLSSVLSHTDWVAAGRNTDTNRIVLAPDHTVNFCVAGEDALSADDVFATIIPQYHDYTDWYDDANYWECTDNTPASLTGQAQALYWANTFAAKLYKAE